MASVNLNCGPPFSAMNFCPEVRCISTPFASLLFGEGVEVLFGSDEQSIVRYRRRGRCPLAELRVRGQHFWLVGSSFQDGYGTVVEGREINIPVGRHRGGIVLTSCSRSLLVPLLARLRVVGGDNSAVLPHDALPAVHERRGDVGQTLGFLPEHVRSRHVAGPARLQCEDAVLSLGHELEDRVPLVTSNLSVLVRVLIVEKTLEGLLGLLARQGSVP